MSDLEKAMSMMMSVFDKYSGAEGNKGSMNKQELRAMVEKELPRLLKDAKDKDEVEKLMDALDHNKDNEVDFTEFVVLVTALTVSFHGIRRR
ncbi:hypothetical protein NHX12_013950 [Muraenolepis orangiensis]|uniref:Protein S100 n=1 Tax=Muraenolepis orangiensis TaxID=630683 RepID=A0A9Q0DAH9_9TELE|nr:hypothetical protein NHX12_013950 [Muraenolepis orangiensis]